MMPSYAEHYATLKDDALIALALRDELADEAQAALFEELARRGISDLVAKRKIRDVEYSAEEATRQEIVSSKIKAIAWFANFIYAISGLCIAFDLYRLSMRGTIEQPDDVGLLLLVGIGFLLLAAIVSVVLRIFIKHILHRRPPRE